MIIRIGNIFDSNATTLVNTVNCVGVMGKGIALEFKKRYPDMFKEYVSLCKDGFVKPGVPYVYTNLLGVSVINFPTKDDWRSPSKLSYIISGLDWFRNHYKEYGIKSVAFPPLGCGNGGLTWDIVGPLMYSKLNDLPIDVEIYAPFGTDASHITEKYLTQNIVDNPTDIIGKKGVKFNKNWLLILYAIQQLNNDKYSLSVGRTIFQKVCYIITRTGVKTGFNFVEASYGPYSKEAKDAITVLYNANYMTERKLGNMVEIVVSPSFKLNYDEFDIQDIKRTDHAVDLLSRIKNTEQAEIIATVLFTYDELLEKTSKPTDSDIIEHVFSWKSRWRNDKEKAVENTILNLSMLGWINPVISKLVISDDDLY